MPRRSHQGKSIECNVFRNKPLLHDIKLCFILLARFETMAPTVRKRSTAALKKTIKQISKITEGFEGYSLIGSEEEYKNLPVTTKIFRNLSDPTASFVQYPTIMETTPLSPTLRGGTKIGNAISTNFLLPGIPKIIGDLWVFIELAITVFQLIFSLVNMQVASNMAFNIIYICLASVNTLLALIDGFLYFYEFTTCKMFYRWCRGIKEEEKDEEEEEEKEEKEKEKEEETEEGKKSKCSRFRVSRKTLEFANKWFEIIRTVLGELLLYPLVVLDLFDLLEGGSFRPTNEQGRVGFSMFIVGSFYLVLSVYIGRTVMSIITIRSLQGLTKQTNNDSSYTHVVVRFLFHVIGQIFVHLLCIMSVGVKIWQENNSNKINGGAYRASPFLWAVIVGGWLIPFMGVVSYFIVNYYWIQNFSLGMFIDMIGLLDEPDFAQAVFEGGGTIKEEAKEKSEKILQNVKYKEVKEEAIERNKNTNPLAKIVYPLKVPVFLLYAFFYNSVVGGFIASLLLGFDEHHNVRVIDLTTTTGVAMVFTIAMVLISNFHVILVINLWVVIILSGFLLLILGSPVFIVAGIVVSIRKYKRKRDKTEEQIPLV